MQMDEKTGSPEEPTNKNNNPALYYMSLEGYTFKTVKANINDVAMPKLLKEKLEDAFVRTSILVTPAIKKYLIQLIEKEYHENLPTIHTRSFKRALKHLNSIPYES